MMNAYWTWTSVSCLSSEASWKTSHGKRVDDWENECLHEDELEKATEKRNGDGIDGKEGRVD